MRGDERGEDATNERCKVDDKARAAKAAIKWTTSEDREKRSVLGGRCSNSLALRNCFR